MKRKNKFILGTAGLALSLMALGGGMYGLNTETLSANADAVATSPYCLTYGVTTKDGEISSGCPDNFKVYMKAARSSGTQTINDGYLSNWSYYYVTIEAIDVTEHLKLELYRNGSLYKSISLPEEGNVTTNFGGLPSGEYELLYECRYKKNWLSSNVYFTYEYSFEVDKTDPTYSISTGSGTSTLYTNKNIYYSANDDHFSCIKYRRGSESTFRTYYGKSYTIPATEENNDYWYFYAVDTLGNQSTTSFKCIDTIAPVGTVTNQDSDIIANGGATNEPFIYSVKDGRSIASIQYKSPSVTAWSAYPENVSILQSDGWYYFRALDEAGNVSDEYRVYYDTTNPLGAVFDSVSAKGSGSVTNKDYVKYTASDSGSGVGTVYVKKPGSSAFVSYTNGSQLTAEGKYYFKAYDKAGNITSTTHEITLDLTAPVGQLKANGVNVSKHSYTSKSFSYSATDAVGVAILQMKRPNSSSWETYTAGTDITGAEGWYSFRATDLAGNVSAESKIFYDTSKLEIHIIKGDIGSSGQIHTQGLVVNTECIRATAADAGSGVKALYVSRNGGAYSLYANGTEITADGRYAFYAVNNASVASDTYNIILDKTAPTGSIYCENTKWDGLSSVTGADYIRFDATDALSGVMACYVLKPGATQFVQCNNTTKFTDEGKYMFYAIDFGNNATPMYSITVNHTAPKGDLYINGALALDNNGYTNAEFIGFIFNEGRGYVIAPNAPSSQYVSGTTYSAEGKYAFWAENEGGQTGTIIVIDRTPKALTLTGVSNGRASGKVEISWTDGNPDVDAPVDTITINGKLYEGETIYTVNGATYEIVCTDKAGNIWKTQFVGEGKDIPTTTMQKEYWEVKDGWSDYVYSFSKHENALTYAMTAERRFVTYKTWSTATWDQGIPMDTKDSANAKNGNYYVYKSESDPEKQVAYFTQARLDEVVKKYAEKTIQHWYYWQKEPESCLDGDLNAYPDENKIVGTAVELREGLIYTLDGEPYSELTITEPGAHTLLIEDGYGGSVEYEIYILDSAPTLQYALGENSPTNAEYDRTYYFNGRVTLSIPMEDDEFAMFVVYYENGDEVGYFDIENACTIEESGIYSAMAVNHFGETEEFKFVVSMNAPTITMTENAEKKTLDIAVEESTDKVSHISFLEIAKSDDGGETWIALTEDDYGKAITNDTLAYRFRTSGIYKITVMDEFRTGIDAIVQTIEYKQPIPVGMLAGVEDKGYTNKNVTFTWKDEAVVNLTKDGIAVEYKSGQKLTVNGAYVLTFSNYDGYTKTYTFVIDTVAPMVTLEGAKSGEFVNAGVKAHFAKDETAEIFKDGKSLGSYMVGSNVEEDGEYRIVVKDKANNETAVTFTIDTTVDWSININEKGLSNSVVVTADEDVEVILTKNGSVVEYTIGDAIAKIGDYSLEIIDSLGNTESRNFSIVAPIVREFTHNFDDVPGFEKVLVNGEDKRLNYGTLELFADGVYEVGVVVNGETYTFTVTVDSTLPEITLNGVENGGVTNGNVTLATTEETATLTVYLNGEEIAYTAGEELTAEGEYRVVATDLANNSVEVTYTIDKKAPVLTLTGVEDGGVTNGNVAISAVDYATVVVYLNDAEIEYTLGGELTEEGSYFVQAWDAVGNVTEAAFTIDKSAPAIALKGVANAGKTNSNVTITVADDATEFKVFLNGKEISYKAGKELKDEGAYKATVKDELGNAVEVSFTIDKTAATLVLNGVENGGKTKGEVSLTELSETATVVVVKDGETIEYTLGELLNEAGRYEITVTDECGNVSEYSFEITKGISGWAITGIVVGSLVVIAGAVFIILKKRGTI